MDTFTKPNIGDKFIDGDATKVITGNDFTDKNSVTYNVYMDGTLIGEGSTHFSHFENMTKVD